MIRTLHHPDLDVDIIRNERQAKVLAGSGWVDVTEPEPARNDTTEVWSDHLDTHGIVHDPDAPRSDLIDLWDARTH